MEPYDYRTDPADWFARNILPNRAPQRFCAAVRVRAAHVALAPVFDKRRVHTELAAALEAEARKTGRRIDQASIEYSEHRSDGPGESVIDYRAVASGAFSPDGTPYLRNTQREVRDFILPLVRDLSANDAGGAVRWPQGWERKALEMSPVLFEAIRDALGGRFDQEQAATTTQDMRRMSDVPATVYGVRLNPVRRGFIDNDVVLVSGAPESFGLMRYLPPPECDTDEKRETYRRLRGSGLPPADALSMVDAILMPAAHG